MRVRDAAARERVIHLALALTLTVTLTLALTLIDLGAARYFDEVQHGLVRAPTHAE